MPDSYTTGKQPCNSFTPQEDVGFGYSLYQCLKCDGLQARAFCLNCLRDHHANGWETCKPQAESSTDVQSTGKEAAPPIDDNGAESPGRGSHGVMEDATAPDKEQKS